MISILLAKFAKEYQAGHIIRDYAREECFEDPSLSPKVVWVTHVSCFTPHHNVIIFDPPNDEMKYHMKSLHLTAMVEDQVVNKVLVDDGVSFNIMLKSMLRRFDKTIEDFITHNIVASNFCGKP